MADLADVAEEATTRRQAIVTTDKVQEALVCENDVEAKDAVLQLAQHVGELQEGEDGE